MPKGPDGQKRPADAIGLAVMVGKIATGEIEDERNNAKSAAAQLGSLGGNKRAANMTPERRRKLHKRQPLNGGRRTLLEGNLFRYYLLKPVFLKANFDFYVAFTLGLNSK